MVTSASTVDVPVITPPALYVTVMSVSNAPVPVISEMTGLELVGVTPIEPVPVKAKVP